MALSELCDPNVPPEPAIPLILEPAELEPVPPVALLPAPNEIDAGVGLPAADRDGDGAGAAAAGVGLPPTPCEALVVGVGVDEDKPAVVVGVAEGVNTDIDDDDAVVPGAGVAENVDPNGVVLLVPLLLLPVGLPLDAVGAAAIVAAAAAVLAVAVVSSDGLCALFDGPEASEVGARGRLAVQQ